MARISFFLLVLSTSASAGWAFWSQTGAFPIDHPSFYGCSLAPLVVTIVALVAAFSPFDKPLSSPLWSAPLVGLALGIAVGGAVFYPPSFVWLGPPLVLYAALLAWLAERVARGAQPAPVSDSGEVEEGSDEDLAPSWLDLDPTTSYGPAPT